MDLPIIDDIRRYHALEHATVAILMGRRGAKMPRLAGRAAIDGFYIVSSIDADEVREAAEEALARLKAGQAEMAISPFCGTNLAVAGTLAGLAAVAAVGRKRNVDSLGNAVAAAMGGIIVAQPVGRWIQQRFTTLPDLNDVTILSVREARLGNVRAVKVKARRGPRDYLEM